jgi:MoxR-like ATPase
MNPFDNVGTTRLSTSLHDRLCRLAVDYQDEEAERGIVALRTRAGAETESPATAALRPQLIEAAVAVTRATRTHEDVRQGSSVRGAIDVVLVALQLAELRGVATSGSDGYGALVFDAMVLGLSARLHVDDAAETTPERVLQEIWEDHFVLRPASAAPG